MVRARICTALGNFKEESVGKILADVYKSDKNIFVQAAAIKALGKIKSVLAKPLIQHAIQSQSWHDVVSAAGYGALKNLQEESSVDEFLSGAQYGKPKQARLAAIAGLGDVALENPKVREFLTETLDDYHFRARYAAASALVARKEPRALGALESSAHRVVDGHFKAMAFRSINKIRRALKKPVEIRDLTEKLDKISSENKKLFEKIEKLEQQKS
jgi:HEAT repeat protein